MGYQGVHKILHDMKCEDTLLLVDRTGGKESHCANGVDDDRRHCYNHHAITSPHRGPGGEDTPGHNQSFGSVEAHLTDDLDESFVRERLIPRMMEISTCSTLCTFNFSFKCR